MTLTECLVAVTILGILAVAVVPSMGLLSKTTQQRDVRQRVMGSWRMAMALAAARQQPVVWQLKGISPNQTQITLLSYQGETLWQTRLDTLLNTDFLQENGSNVVFERSVNAHGVTDPFILKWEQDSQIQQMTVGDPRELASAGGRL